MTVCPACTAPIPPSVADTTRRLLAVFGSERRAWLAATYQAAESELPEVLCASCFLSALSAANVAPVSA